MSDPLDSLRAALTAAKAIQADMDALGVAASVTVTVTLPEPPTPTCAGCGLAIEDDPHLIKYWSAIDVREYWHSRCYMRDHMGLLLEGQP